MTAGGQVNPDRFESHDRTANQEPSHANRRFPDNVRNCQELPAPSRNRAGARRAALNRRAHTQPPLASHHSAGLRPLSMFSVSSLIYGSKAKPAATGGLRPTST